MAHISIPKGNSCAITRNGLAYLCGIDIEIYEQSCCIDFINSRNQVLNAGALHIPVEAIDKLAISWLKERGILSLKDCLPEGG